MSGRRSQYLPLNLRDPPPFAPQSVTSVNIETEIGVTNRPDSRRWPLVDLREARAGVHHLELDQRVAAALASRTMSPVAVLVCVQTCWKELRIRFKGKSRTYRISSSRCLCSTTSLGRESKCSSNVTICERRILTLFLTARDPCWNRFCQRSILRRRSRANFAIIIKHGDGFEGSLEGTELFCGPFCPSK